MARCYKIARFLNTFSYFFRILEAIGEPIDSAVNGVYNLMEGEIKVVEGLNDQYPA